MDTHAILRRLVAIALAATAASCLLAGPGVPEPVRIEVACGTSGSRGALFDDAEVATVSVRVLDQTDTEIGTGTMARGASSWTGRIAVSQTGLAAFEASAIGSSGAVLFTGTAEVVLTGSGDAVFIPMAVAVSVEMLTVDGGAFVMGAAGTLWAEPEHDVTVTSFAIGKYEVTFDQYDAFCNDTARAKPGDGGFGRGARPVVYVSASDVFEFCNWLSDREGLDRVYVLDGSTWVMDRGMDGYRVPTEAEWEFAASGGGLGQGHPYAGAASFSGVGWTYENSGGVPHPVGGLAPNELGACDMTGNALELCWDFFGDYPAGPQVDPTGPASGSVRALRGGSWSFDGDDCTVHDRVPMGGTPDVCGGFRLARTLPLNDAEATAADADALAIGFASGDSAEAVSGDLTLPGSGQHGTTVAWASSDQAVIETTGVVRRPFAPSPPSVTLTATVTRNAASVDRDFVLSVVPRRPVTMVAVQGGGFSRTFMSTTQWVTVSGFSISECEITFDQYDAFCEATSRTPAPDDFNWGRGDRPVINVTWYDAVEYCNWLSTCQGLTEAYAIDKATPDPGNLDTNDPYKWTVTVVPGAPGYRLPTEAEWEWAASGGPLTHGYPYAGSATADEVAWFYDNSGIKTQPVGTKASNELGIFDMSGNAGEWCWDWYGGYSSSPETDPTGPTSGLQRMVKGGTWFSDASGIVVTVHVLRGNPSSSGNDDRGFRVVRRP